MNCLRSNPPTPWGPVCESLGYLPPIVLPPRRAENGIYPGFTPPRTSQKLQTPQKSRGWLRFRRFFDRKHRSDEIYHFQKNVRANVVQKLRANVENHRASVVVVVAGVGGMAEPLNKLPGRSIIPTDRIIDRIEPIIESIESKLTKTNNFERFGFSACFRPPRVVQG